MRWRTPTPIAQRALISITDARKALERGEQSLNATQIEDAIRSAEFFLNAARDALNTQPESPQPDRTIPHIPMPSPAR